MKLLDFILDEFFATRDYEGMVRAVANQLCIPSPRGRPFIDTCTPNPAHWCWGRIIIFCDGFCWTYDRGGATSKVATFVGEHQGIVLEGNP